MKVSISAILRHRKLKFGIQIPFDLRKESFWLLGGFDYHGNRKVSSCQPLLNIECSNCVCRSFMIFLNWVADFKMCCNLRGKEITKTCESFMIVTMAEQYTFLSTMKSIITKFIHFHNLQHNQMIHNL